MNNNPLYIRDADRVFHFFRAKMGGDIECFQMARFYTRMEKNMKILGLSFSPRKQGNTEILMREVLDSACGQGAETELYRTVEKNIRPCDACGHCFKTGECPIEDDMQEVYAKMLSADGILFGTPVYFYNMTAQGKCVIDRTIALNHGGRSLSSKVGGVVAVAGSLGLVDAVKDLYFYMATRQMLPASFIAAYGSNEGDVKDYDQCIQAARALGKQMTDIIRMGFKYPGGKASYYAYGTHTF